MKLTEGIRPNLMLLAIFLLFSLLCDVYSFTLFNQILHGKGQVHRNRVPGLPLWKTSAAASQETTNLQGFNKFIRSNPMSDKFVSRRFHHIEFYTGEATAVSGRFAASLGMNPTAKSDLSTGNSLFASYLMQSGDVRMLFTTPYAVTNGTVVDQISHPSYSTDVANAFIMKHGLGVRAIAIEVENVSHAFHVMADNGGRPVLSPTRVEEGLAGYVDIAEIALYGDAVLRLINVDHFKGKFLPNYVNVDVAETRTPRHYGIQRFDHIVGNVWNLSSQAAYMKKMTGFHEFAEFVAEDVGTVDSGLNSVVLANNNEFILLPINEPTYGTKRKSQIQTYLEQNLGEGVQHIALFSNDIFHTLKQMKAAADYGIGFTFMNPPPMQYYEKVKERIQPFPLTEEQLAFAKEIGLLIDRDDQGVLLQIFTKPVGDRPTVFLEIIQRVGCEDKVSGVQKPGCGGFGKGNFRDLFKSIEEYEKKLGIN